MHVHRITFSASPATDYEVVARAADEFLNALRMNGQVLGREWTLYIEGDDLAAIVKTPEHDSLGGRFYGDFVRAALERVRGQGIEVGVAALGDRLHDVPACACTQRSGLVMYTHFPGAQSPLSCLDCFEAVPLYRMPLVDGDYHRLLSWQSDWQNCDRLQMDARTLERAATREIADLRSALCVEGRACADELAGLTGIPVYYHLHRGNGRTLRSERARRCPGCDCEWLLPEPLHARFDFRCDACRLLSNVAGNVDRPVAPSTDAKDAEG